MYGDITLGSCGIRVQTDEHVPLWFIDIFPKRVLILQPVYHTSILEKLL